METLLTAWTIYQTYHFTKKGFKLYQQARTIHDFTVKIYHWWSPPHELHKAIKEEYHPDKLELQQEWEWLPNKNSLETISIWKKETVNIENDWVYLK